MGEAVLRVTAVGPVTTIQDAGRPGLMRFGVPASGPMDRHGFAIAHAALGVPEGPAVEVSVGGLELECVSGRVAVAVAGGGFRVEADGEAGPSWTVRPLERGSVLSIRPGPWGSWTYLAFAGRLVAPVWLGSAATHLPSGRGGGRLEAGRRLTVTDTGPAPRAGRPIPFPVTGRPRARVRVVAGPQQRFFPEGALDTLLTARFTLTAAYDRMGVRLAGPSLAPEGPLTMPSEPLARGSVQVAGDGVATVLLADHQTTGGYPRIATVVADDLDGFAQLRSRDAVTFSAVTPEAAVGLARTVARARAAHLARLRAAAG